MAGSWLTVYALNLPSTYQGYPVAGWQVAWDDVQTSTTMLSGFLEPSTTHCGFDSRPIEETYLGGSLGAWLYTHGGPGVSPSVMMVWFIVRETLSELQGTVAVDYTAKTVRPYEPPPEKPEVPEPQALEKSQAIKDWLLSLNFVILGIEISIGDWIEVALDWALYWLNYVQSFGETAYNYAVQLSDQVQGFWEWTQGELSKLQAALEGWVTAAFDNLNISVSALWDYVSAWAVYIPQAIGDAIAIALQPIKEAWESYLAFTADTLPDLLNLDWLGAWWGNTTTTFAEWWWAAQQQIADQTEAQLAPVRDEVNKHSSWLDGVKQLLEDPEAWVLARLEDALVRFW